MTLWILPRNEQNTLRILSAFLAFYGRINDALICFRYLVTFMTIFSHSQSEQFWKQNTISTMWFSFIGAVCLFVMRFVKRAIYMQVTSAPSLPKHLIIMRPLKIQIVVFLPVVEIIAQEPKKVMKLILNNYIHFSINPSTPAGTFSITQ